MSWSVFKLAWAKNGTPDTLSGTADVMTISDVVPYKFQMFMIHSLQTGAGDATVATRFNDDSSGNYARRRIHNVGTDTTGTSDTYAYWYGSASVGDMFTIVYNINIATEEKLNIMHQVIRMTAGATTAPSREEHVGKWANTSNQITDVDVNTGAGDYNTGSNTSSIGTD